MARHNKTGRSKNGPPFVMARHWLLDSPAWQALSPAACKVYMAIARHYNGSNNGQIGMGCRRAADLCGINRNTANRALNELQEFGFIRLRIQGTFSRKDGRQSEWVLTEHPHGEENATSDFMRWRSPEKKTPVPKMGTDGPKNEDRGPVGSLARGVVRPKNEDRAAA